MITTDAPLTPAAVEKLDGLSVAESPAFLPAAVVAPAVLPGWLDELGRTPRSALEAVMFHPAAEVAAAIWATGTNELQALLEHLAWVRPEEAARG